MTMDKPRSLLEELQLEIDIIRQSKPAMRPRSFEEKHLLSSLEAIKAILDDHDRRLKAIESRVMPWE